MSANPEAFEFLRKAAYRFVQKNGKDSHKLRGHCVLILAEWRNGDGAGSELKDTEAEQIIGDVTRWTIKRYNPPRKKASRSREERAATEVSADLLLEFAAETFGVATIRNAARVGGQSKSTVARHLRQKGISPTRKKKIEKLPPMEQRLTAILDETFPRDGAGLVLINDLATALWDGQVSTPMKPLPEIPRSTKSTRRKKLAIYLAAVSAHGLGFHLLSIGNAVAVRRGRRFRDMKDALIWIEDEKRLRGFRGIVLPEAAEEKKNGFWDDPWLTCVLAVLEIGLRSHFTEAQVLEPFVRLTHPVIDTRPLYPWIQRAIDSYASNDFAENLTNLSRMIVDPDVRKAVGYVAAKIGRIQAWAKYDDPVSYFDLVDLDIEFMKRLRDIAPDSYARCKYVRDVIFMEFAKLEHETRSRNWDALAHCNSLREQERSGEWIAPTARELDFYHPDNEPPF